MILKEEMKQPIQKQDSYGQTLLARASPSEAMANSRHMTKILGNMWPLKLAWEITMTQTSLPIILKFLISPAMKRGQKNLMQYVENGNLPQLQIVRLPNDHTLGTKKGELTPQAMVAQNDYALGKLVETVSNSPYWKETAIFVTEDDAQNGWDSVDAHRTTSLVISPYTQTGNVDSTLYDTTSMLRTMEMILGMKPMTQYDASAVPMINSFTHKPNFESI